jgi:hypothetical protein
MAVWARFDRAVAASDMVGTQLPRSSVRDKAQYSNAVDTLIDGARFMQRQFNRPSLIVDLAISRIPRRLTKRDRECRTRSAPAFAAAVRAESN